MAPQANTRALFVDALGTLLRLEPVPPRLRAALSARGIEVSVEDAARAFQAEVAYYLAHQLEGRDQASLATLRERCADVVAAALGVPAGPTVLEALLEAIRFSAFEDAGPALERVRAKGLTVVVVSNWDCSLPEVLERVGLAQLVDHVVSSAAVGAAKPDPAIFDCALRTAHCAPGEALHVGDSADNDLKGAAAAGVRAVLLDRDGTGPAGAIRSMSELPALI
jgi:putative hydrolase of the HAD superfamily